MRGQVLAEFLVVFSAFLVLLLIYSIIFSEYLSSYFSSNNNLKLFSTAYKFSSAINSVFISGPGTSYNFSIDLTDMNMSVDDNILNVWIENRSALSTTLLTERVNILLNNSSDISIVNNGGMIEVS